MIIIQGLYFSPFLNYPSILKVPENELVRLLFFDIPS